jgi:hypothetical protein
LGAGRGSGFFGLGGAFGSLTFFSRGFLGCRRVVVVVVVVVVVMVLVVEVDVEEEVVVVVDVTA